MSKTLYYDSNTHQLVIGDCSSNELDPITVEPTLSSDTFKVSEDGKLQIKINGNYVFVGDKSLIGPVPQLKIETDYWYTSDDNGATWKRLGKATGADGKDGTNGTNGADGKDGQDGADGQDGKDGITYYTWIKYAKTFPTADTELYDSPDATTEYLGIATNKLEQTESDNYEDYKWSKLKGDQGIQGEPGKDLTLTSAFPPDPQLGDRILWNGPSKSSTLVPCGYTETGEIYEYCNSNALPEHIQKTESIVELGLSFSELTSYKINQLLAKEFISLYNRKPKKYMDAGTGCIKVNFSQIPDSSHPLAPIVKIYLSGKAETGNKTSQLKTIADFMDANVGTDLYWKGYTESSDLEENKCYWIPVSSFTKLTSE